MVHTIQNMDRKSPSNTVFSRLTPQEMENFSPVSVSPRMITCDQTAGMHSERQIAGSFINFKIEVLNDSSKKRKLDDSGLSDCYGSKVKYPRMAVSPDLGCFMDYSSPHERGDSMSPFSPSFPDLSENAQTHTAETKDSVSTQLNLELVESGNSYSKDEVETEHGSKKIRLRLSPTFDYDVDDILCLNPLVPEGQEGNKEATPAVVAVEDDKGYVSTSLDQKEESPAESSPEPKHDEQAPMRGQQVSFKNKDLSTSGSLLKPANSSARCLEGDEEEEGWNIGMPLFESSICQSSAAVEHRKQMLEVLQEPVKLVSRCSAGDSTFETSYEDSLPLQVQVKSKVEIPSHPSIEQKAKQNGDKTVQRSKIVMSPRSSIWNNKKEWEEKKRRYVASVTSHMAENRNNAQGSTSELQALMTQVFEQMGSNGRNWKHPSDLTSRNYQKRFGNETPKMTLSEWKARNLTAHKRFSKVPKIFERSPFP